MCRVRQPGFWKGARSLYLNMMAVEDEEEKKVEGPGREVTAAAVRGRGIHFAKDEALSRKKVWQFVSFWQNGIPEPNYELNHESAWFVGSPSPRFHFGLGLSLVTLYSMMLTLSNVTNFSCFAYNNHFKTKFKPPELKNKNTLLFPSRSP